jgi:hypothetical protein
MFNNYFHEFNFNQNILQVCNNFFKYNYQQYLINIINQHILQVFDFCFHHFIQYCSNR